MRAEHPACWPSDCDLAVCREPADTLMQQDTPMTRVSSRHPHGSVSPRLQVTILTRPHIVDWRQHRVRCLAPTGCDCCSAAESDDTVWPGPGAASQRCHYYPEMCLHVCCSLYCLQHYNVSVLCVSGQWPWSVSLCCNVL